MNNLIDPQYLIKFILNQKNNNYIAEAGYQYKIGVVQFGITFAPYCTKKYFIII